MVRAISTKITSMRKAGTHDNLATVTQGRIFSNNTTLGCGKASFTSAEVGRVATSLQKVAPRPAVSFRHLPNELKVEILKHLLVFPRGIHGSRYPSICRSRIEKLIEADKEGEWADLIPDIVFGCNEVAICFRNGFAEEGTLKTLIAIPRPCVRDLVKDLRIQFQVYSAGEADSYIRQVVWLKHLANDNVGFENVTNLTLEFKSGPAASSESLKDTCTPLKTIGPLVLPARKIRFIVGDHECDKTCVGDKMTAHCREISVLRALITTRAGVATAAASKLGLKTLMKWVDEGIATELGYECFKDNIWPLEDRYTIYTREVLWTH